VTETSNRVWLNDDFVARLPTPASGEARVWDTEIVGFCIRLHPSGRRTFCLKSRAGGKSIWTTIGPFGPTWSTEAARSAAARLLAPPAHAPSLGALNSVDSSVGLLTSALIEIYLDQGPQIALTKRASSWKIDASNLRRHVAPLLGQRLVVALTSDDVARMCVAIRDGKTAVTVKTGPRGIARVRGGPGAAAITLRIFKAMMEWAVKRDLAINNPCKGVRLPRLALRDRVLSREEARRLIAAINHGQALGAINQGHGDILKLLMLTGARRTEIMGMRWSEVDLRRRLLVLPPERSKTGSKTGERRIALSEAAAVILESRAQDGPYVFPAGRGDGHTTGLQKTWERVRSSAGLDGMRVHDLRHSFASFAMEAGENILAISAALGHASTQMTERYLHLQGGAAAGLAARTSAYILA
jgi:integrase